MGGLVACTTGEVEEGSFERFMQRREAQGFRGKLASSEGPALPASAAKGGERGAWTHRFVVLEGPSAVEAMEGNKAKPDARAVSAARTRLREIEAQQAAVLPLIEATGARVTARFKRLANAIQVTAPVEALEALGRVPGVVRLDTVVMHERRLKSAVPFVGGYKAWSAQGATIHGEGVRVGIVDTGIDYLHADFGGPGTPEAYQANDPAIIEPGSFPTVKVAGGTDFVGDTYDASIQGSTPLPDADPLDCQGLQGMAITGGHGTHVAGITAGQGVLNGGQPFDGPYDQSLSPSQFRVGPGVAPKATLYALKVFGCDGSTTMTDAALEWAADPDDDGDFSDRLDVLNLSLGGSYGLASITELSVVKNLTDLGSFLAIAAGNEGNTFYVTGWPSTATEALAVAATTDAISFQALTIEAPASIAGDVACLEGAFTAPLSSTGVIQGELAYAQPALACNPLTNADEMKGKIAFIDRGSCTFVKKITNALDAGAIAVVVADQEDSDVPFAMGGDGADVGIPGVLIRKVDGDKIRDQLASGVTVKMDPAKDFVTSITADQVAGFSSRGPRVTDNAPKPDLGAPGVAIDSAGVGTGTGPRQLQGTSMACPMVAGAAALVRQANPDYSPALVKAALMNSAAPAQGPSGEPVPVSMVGAGRLQVDRALETRVTAAAVDSPGAVSVSFGTIIGSQPASVTRAVEVNNSSDADATFALSVAPTYELEGVTFELSQPEITVPARGTATVELTIKVDPAQLPLEKPDPLTPEQAPYVDQARHFVSEAGGHLVLTGATTLSVPYLAVIRAADERKVSAAPVGCGAAGPILLPLEGLVTNKNPVTTVFELGGTSNKKGSNGSPAKIADLLAVGVATNLPTAEAFNSASVYFGLVVDGRWTTPAMGQQSVVGIRIDVNGDNKADYTTLVQPLTQTGPYLDVLTAVTYNLKNGQASQPRFVNIFPRDQVNTHPFNNSVLVLPVSLSALGLKAGKASFNYQAFSSISFPVGASDQTTWASYNPEALAIDTAKNGRENRPLFEGTSPISIELGPAAVPGQLPRVLLLHHTNVREMSHEIVDLNTLVSADQADLALKLQGDIPSGTVGTAIVTNNGPSTAKNVSLSLSITAPASLTLTPSAGSCEGTTCSLGDVEPGAEVTVKLAVQGAQGSFTVSGTAAAESCDTDATNNKSSLTGQSGSAGAAGAAGAAGQSGAAGQAPALAPVEVGGGCDCGVAPSPARGPQGAAASALALLAALVRLRRPGRRR